MSKYYSELSGEPLSINKLEDFELNLFQNLVHFIDVE